MHSETLTDKERIYRWITQADLEKMLADAYQKGAEAMREYAADWYDRSPTVSVGLMRRLPLPKDNP